MAIIALGIQLLASAPHKQAQGKRAAVVLANSDTIAQEGSTSLLCCAPAAAAPGTSAAAQAVTTQLKPPLQRAASNHNGWKYRSEHPWIPPPGPLDPARLPALGRVDACCHWAPRLPARQALEEREREKKREQQQLHQPIMQVIFFPLWKLLAGRIPLHTTHPSIPHHPPSLTT